MLENQPIDAKDIDESVISEELFEEREPVVKCKEHWNFSTGQPIKSRASKMVSLGVEGEDLDHELINKLNDSSSEEEFFINDKDECQGDYSGLLMDNYKAGDTREQEDEEELAIDDDS